MSNQENPKALVLRPAIGPIAEDFLTQRSLLNQLVTSCGSPVNILLPQALNANVRSFQEVLTDHQLQSKIFFAHKANQSDSLIRQLATLRTNIDVSSIEELRHALSSGFTGSRIEATGPKSVEFLHLCLLHGVTVNIDSLQELKELNALHNAYALEKSRILLRLCRLAPREQISKQSRFGITPNEANEALSMIVSARRNIDFLGFAFHLDTTSIEDRVTAIDACLQLFDKAIIRGLAPSVLNIGGGFRINYLCDAEDWHRYTTAIQQAALGKGPQLTWQNNFFGLSAHGDGDKRVLTGQLNSYGYYEPTPGPAFLNELLNSQLPAYGSHVASVLRQNMIELWIEPGRAIVDQCGITLAQVISVKKSSEGDTLVGLNMKRQDIAFLDQEIFVDPILLQNANEPANESSLYLSGNLCLESDLIFRRKVTLPALPQPGDILAFINTAAYMMDFSATNSIMQPRAKRIAAVKGLDWIWMLDETYTPTWRRFHKRS